MDYASGSQQRSSVLSPIMEDSDEEGSYIDAESNEEDMYVDVESVEDDDNTGQVEVIPSTQESCAHGSVKCSVSINCIRTLSSGDHAEPIANVALNCASQASAGNSTQNKSSVAIVPVVNSLSMMGALQGRHHNYKETVTKCSQPRSKLRIRCNETEALLGDPLPPATGRGHATAAKPEVAGPSTRTQMNVCGYEPQTKQISGSQVSNTHKISTAIGMVRVKISDDWAVNDVQEQLGSGTAERGLSEPKISQPTPPSARHENPTPPDHDNTSPVPPPEVVEERSPPHLAPTFGSPGSAPSLDAMDMELSGTDEDDFPLMVFRGNKSPAGGSSTGNSETESVVSSPSQELHDDSPDKRSPEFNSPTSAACDKSPVECGWPTDQPDLQAVKLSGTDSKHPPFPGPTVNQKLLPEPPFEEDEQPPFEEDEQQPSPPVVPTTPESPKCPVREPSTPDKLRPPRATSPSIIPPLTQPVRVIQPPICLAEQRESPTKQSPSVARSPSGTPTPLHPIPALTSPVQVTDHQSPVGLHLPSSPVKQPATIQSDIQQDDMDVPGGSGDICFSDDIIFPSPQMTGRRSASLSGLAERLPVQSPAAGSGRSAGSSKNSASVKTVLPGMPSSPISKSPTGRQRSRIGQSNEQVQEAAEVVKATQRRRTSTTERAHVQRSGLSGSPVVSTASKLVAKRTSKDSAKKSVVDKIVLPHMPSPISKSPAGQQPLGQSTELTTEKVQDAAEVVKVAQRGRTTTTDRAGVQPSGLSDGPAVKPASKVMTKRASRDLDKKGVVVKTVLPDMPSPIKKPSTGRQRGRIGQSTQLTSEQVQDTAEGVKVTQRRRTSTTDRAGVQQSGLSDDPAVKPVSKVVAKEVSKESAKTSVQSSSPQPQLLASPQRGGGGGGQKRRGRWRRLAPKMPADNDIAIVEEWPVEEECQIDGITWNASAIVAESTRLDRGGVDEANVTPPRVTRSMTRGHLSDSSSTPIPVQVPARSQKSSSKRTLEQSDDEEEFPSRIASDPESPVAAKPPAKRAKRVATTTPTTKKKRGKFEKRSGRRGVPATAPPPPRPVGTRTPRRRGPGKQKADGPRGRARALSRSLEPDTEGSVNESVTTGGRELDSRVSFSYRQHASIDRQATVSQLCQMAKQQVAINKRNRSRLRVRRDDQLVLVDRIKKITNGKPSARRWAEDDMSSSEDFTQQMFVTRKPKVVGRTPPQSPARGTRSEFESEFDPRKMKKNYSSRPCVSIYDSKSRRKGTTEKNVTPPNKSVFTRSSSHEARHTQKYDDNSVEVGSSLESPARDSPQPSSRNDSTANVARLQESWSNHCHIMNKMSSKLIRHSEKTVMKLVSSPGKADPKMVHKQISHVFQQLDIRQKKLLNWHLKCAKITELVSGELRSSSCE